MTEAEFWIHLEFRLCHEFDGLAGKEFCGLWCDGFIPEQFEIHAKGAFFTGRVWLGFGQKKQEAWDFCLHAGKKVTGRDVIAWADLLPAADVTGWLVVDWAKKLLTIKPENARPDVIPQMKNL
jgi:hypothetical protein